MKAGAFAWAALGLSGAAMADPPNDPGRAPRIELVPPRTAAEDIDAITAQQRRLLEEHGMFALVTYSMGQPQKLLLCGEVGRGLAEVAGETADAAKRDGRLAEADAYNARLAPWLEAAREGLEEAEIAAFEQENKQALILMTYAPEIDGNPATIDPDDFGYLFVAGVAKRCSAYLETLGQPPVP